MDIKELIYQENNTKIGKECKYIEPNIKKDTLLYLNGEVVGFYISSVSGNLKSLLDIANNEFLSERVPKEKMNRGTEKMAIANGLKWIEQYSTVLGSRAPKPHMRMPYASQTRVHTVKTARTFIKAMLMACYESESILKNIMPIQYERQKQIFEKVLKEWRFGNLFTSSISNYNISAPYHRDNANAKNTVNIILTKRLNSKGGCLNVPDYGVTFEQADNSMLVYPAWMNVHGVTPIIKTHESGYRNSFIFYPLKAFLNIT